MSPIDKVFPLPPKPGETSLGFDPARPKPGRVDSLLAVAAAMVALALWALPLAAQTTGVDGQVRVGAGQEETGGASVKIYDPQLGLVDSTVTDTQGRFYFQAVAPGDYTLVTSKPGYLTKEQELKIRFSTPGQYVTVFLTAEGVLMKGKGNPQVTAAELALPPKVRKEFEKGKNELKKRKYAAGIQHLKVVTDAQPQFALGFEVLGVAHARAGNFADAEKAFQTTIQLDPKRSEPYIQLGALAYDQGRYPASEDKLQKGLALDPGSRFGHYQLGLTYFALQNYSSSEKELRRAQELDPAFSEINVKLGNVYLRQQNPSKALAEFQHYLEKDPKGRLAPRVRQVVNEMRAAGVRPAS